MGQTVVDFIARVAPHKAADLDALLKQIAQDVRGNETIPFGKLPSVHFSNIIVFESQDFGSCLVWEHNFDSSLDTYLDELLRVAPGIDRLLSCCDGYSAGNGREFMKSHLASPGAYHVGAVGRSVDRIIREADLRKRIERFVDSHPRHHLSPDALRAEIQQFVAKEPALSWVRDPELRMTSAERVTPYINIGLVGLILFIAVIVILWIKWWLLPLAVVVVISLLIWHEKHDQPNVEMTSPDHIRRLLVNENTSAQNHLASITVIKPGVFRRSLLRLVLFAANLLARTSTKGELAGIPSIHFAHWTMIDGGRRLLFLSNYGGSWGSYLDDFIDKVSYGLTGIWSNTAGFPKAEFLILKGSRDGPRFKNFARDSQALTRVRYCAYPHLTVRNINDNSALREGIFGEVDAREWLRLL